MMRHAAPVQAGYSVSHGKRGPAGVGYSMQQVSDTCTRITGRAYVGEVNTTGKISATSGSNCLGLIFDVNPVLLNDRVAVIASTFEKYVYHGMKFTYVPQCPTSTPGSVGLVFDRDPLQYSANAGPTGTQFLSEVMSYEHAVLTPAYVEASTAFSRDPKELKTWFLGSTDATLTTRETSQGNLLVYISNGTAPNTTTGFTGGYGFVVMDYVLDLVAPNLLPNKQNVTSVYNAPSQWRDANGSRVTTTSFTALGPGALPDGAGTVDGALFGSSAAWGATWTHGELRVGTVAEIHFGGCAALAGANAANAVATFGTTDGATVTIANGQKLYMTAHRFNSTLGTDDLCWSFHLTLSSARAAAGANWPTFGAAQEGSYGDYLVKPVGSTVAVSGWLRWITDGAGVVDNA